MARTLAEIRQEIKAQKLQYAELNLLQDSSNDIENNTPQSDTAIWELWIYVMAFALYVHEKLFDKHKEEVEEIQKITIAGTQPWYVNKVLQYQKDGNLIVDTQNFQFRYDPVVPENQIIKQVSISSNAGLSLIKVATEGEVLDNEGNPVFDDDGNPVTELKPLDGADFPGLRSYLRKIQFAGTQVQVISPSPDQLKFEADIYYNALLDLDTIKKNVNKAIEDYLSNLPFDGEILISRLVDAVQRVEGVNDTFVKNVETKRESSEFKVILRNYETLSGYIQVSPDFPLANTLKYVAN